MTKLFFRFDKHKNNIVVLLTLGKSKKYCHFADFGQVKKYFRLADFGQVEKYCRFADLGKSLGWPLIFNLNKTPLGETGCLSNPYFSLTDCLGIQFFDSFTFPNTVS